MTSSTLVKCNSMIISIVMPSYPNVSLFLCYIGEHCSYSKYDNQPQNSLNQMTLNIIQKIMCQFTILLTEHFDLLLATMLRHARELQLFLCVRDDLCITVCFYLDFSMNGFIFLHLFFLLSLYLVVMSLCLFLNK